MKVGDRLLCKKTYCGSSKNDIWITEGNHYYITELSHIDFIILDNYNDSTGFSFFADGRYAWRYFYTIQEERKIKLKKIKDKL